MEFLYLDKVDSTNKWAKENIDTLKDKTLIYTGNQTSGRGRLNRKWTFAGADNVYASIILKPSDEMKSIYSNLTQYLCVKLCEVFEQYGVNPKIKWPNDILINGKKISGILAEGVIREGKLKGLILGFGVNLNTSIEVLSSIDKPATSLNIELNKDIDREDFLKTLTSKFCLMYDEFIEKGFLLIKDDYIRRAEFLNKEVTVNVYDTPICGIVNGINDEGALLLSDKNNRKHILLIGDIL